MSVRTLPRDLNGRIRGQIDANFVRVFGNADQLGCEDKILPRHLQLPPEGEMVRLGIIDGELFAAIHCQIKHPIYMAQGLPNLEVVN